MCPVSLFAPQGFSLPFSNIIEMPGRLGDQKWSLVHRNHIMVRINFFCTLKPEKNFKTLILSDYSQIRFLYGSAWLTFRTCSCLMAGLTWKIGVISNGTMKMLELFSFILFGPIKFRSFPAFEIDLNVMTIKKGDTRLCFAFCQSQRNLQVMTHIIKHTCRYPALPIKEIHSGRKFAMISHYAPFQIIPNELITSLTTLQKCKL